MAHRKHKRLPVRYWLVASLLALAGLRLWYDQLQTEQLLTRRDPLVAGHYQCVRIIEPLALVVQGTDPLTRGEKPFPVCLAGIRLTDNPPQSSPLSSTESGSPAVFLARRVPPGQAVRLEFDRQRFDRDRLPLAYVLVKDRLVNAELVAAGLAVPDPLPGHSSPRQKQINQAARPD